MRNNLKQIGLAILNFESAYKKLPTGGEGTDWTSKSSTFSTQSLFTHLLPFIEPTDVYNSMDLTKSYRDAAAPAERRRRQNQHQPLRVPDQSVLAADGSGGLRRLGLLRHRLDRHRSGHGYRNRATPRKAPW